MSAQQHQSDPRTLDRRTLQKDHRCLAEMLAAGMSVLDVGCGTGAITRGIAEAVGPGGKVVGVDRDAGLIARARATNASLPNLRFEERDVTALGFEGEFDVVTSARTLQWVSRVGEAVQNMARAAKPGGLLVVLDYNHALNAWDPAAPGKFTEFYRAFLDWRRSNGWDNEMGNRLAEIFGAAGLVEIRQDVQDEVSEVGDPDFAVKTGIWTEVIDNTGGALQKGGFCGAELLEAARNSYEEWRSGGLKKQVLSLRSVVARVPGVAFEEAQNEYEVDK